MARKLGARVMMGVRAEVARRHGCVPNVDRQPVRCEYCGAPGTLTWTMTPSQTVGRVVSSLDWDHKHPVLLGGSNGADNIALACTPCNARKGARPFDEFMGER
jgi:5-methylcytosine-specific restriction endonuclease McrA